MDEGNKLFNYSWFFLSLFVLFYFIFSFLFLKVRERLTNLARLRICNWSYIHMYRFSAIIYHLTYHNSLAQNIP